MNTTNCLFRVCLKSILIVASLLPQISKAQVAHARDSIQQAIDETSGASAVLNRLGISKPKITSAESFLDFNKQLGEKGFVSTDGPTIAVESEISTKRFLPVSLQDSVKLRASLTMMFNEWASIDQSELKTPIAHHQVDWNHFFREAKIIMDIDPKTNIPVATIIAGVQDLESGAFNTAMPLPDNSPIRGLTRVRSAHAIQVQLNSKLFDSLSLAALTTGAGHPETMGDNIQANAPGATVMISKTLSDRLKINGALTRISYADQAEIRLNTGIAYENKEGDYTLYFDHVYMPNKGNPLYPDATVAWTLGVIKKINSKHLITAEATHVNNINDRPYNEVALGYKYSLTERTSVGMEVRKTSTGTRVGARLAYSYGEK